MFRKRLSAPRSLAIALLAVLHAAAYSQPLAQQQGAVNQSGRAHDSRYAVLSQYSRYIETCLSYSRQGRHEEVIELASKAVQLDLNEPLAYNYLTIGYAGQSNFREAIKASDKYLELMEDRQALSRDAILRHAHLLKEGASKDEAITFLQRHRDRFPGGLDMYLDELERE
jgi:tetratricopeptide (TPR) repeat protein